MTKQFNLLQLFSIVDGRLSTKMEDVYLMLNHICDTELMTHNLPPAMEYVKSKNPKWFGEVKEKINIIKDYSPTNNFERIISFVKDHTDLVFDIPQLKDEFDTSDFADYMVDNSLLLKHFK